MQGNTYQVALAQIITSLGSSKTSMAFAMMSVKLINKGNHRRADVFCQNGDGPGVAQGCT